MYSDDNNSDDGERRYRPQVKSAKTTSSILKNSSLRKNVLNSDDEDDNYNSARLSNRNRYESPLNSYRSDEVAAKPPSGRLQPIGSSATRGDTKLKSLGDYNRRPLESAYDLPKSRSNLPAISSYTSSSSGLKNTNNFNDSDDSTSENYNKFIKKSDSSKFDKRYDNSKFDSKYDTYDEDDKKETSSKYFRSDGPLKSSISNTKLNPLDDLSSFPRSSSAREPRSLRSNSLDRLNASSPYSSMLQNGTGSARLNKYNSTHNIGGLDNSPDRSHTANSLNSTTLSVREAKARSFLVGSLSALNGKGLLSAEELDRSLPERRARVLLATWNMGEVKSLPQNLDDLLLPETIQTMPDLYIIGVQEMDLNNKEWEIKLQEQIGPSHVKLGSHFYGSIGITIFIRRELIWYCSIVEFEHINLRGTGPINTPVKTKASVVISFQLFGTLMCFICSHFSAGEGNLNQRIENYKTTVSNITLPKRLQNKSKAISADKTENFDCVFWIGDLNFLNTKERDKVERKIHDVRYRNSLNFEEIMNHDELYQVINQEKAFKNFLEGRITFEPTYKYDVNSDKYDTSEKCRIPSYTDRILYRSRTKGIVSCSVYDAIKEIKLSDHRPVYGLYEVAIRPGVDKIPLSYGDFDRQVYAAGYEKRKMFRAHNIGFGSQAKKSICAIQ